MSWEPRVSQSEYYKAVSVARDLHDKGYIRLWDVVVVKRIFGIAWLGPEDWKRYITADVKENPEKISEVVERVISRIHEEGGNMG